jgi:hypothetical protein
MLNLRSCKQNRSNSKLQAADLLPKSVTPFYKTPTTADLFRRFSSRLIGLVNPQGDGNFVSEEPAGSRRQTSPQRWGVTGVNSANLSLIPLQIASLCLDCEMITPAHSRCSACGSVALLSIAKTLSHPRVVELSRESDLVISDIASVQVTCHGNFLQST